MQAKNQVVSISKQAINRLKEAEIIVSRWNGCYNKATSCYYFQNTALN